MLIDVILMLMWFNFDNLLRGQRGSLWSQLPQSETALSSFFRRGVIVALWDSDLLSETSTEDGRKWLTWGNQGEKEKHV